MGSVESRSLGEVDFPGLAGFQNRVGHPHLADRQHVAEHCRSLDSFQ